MNFIKNEPIACISLIVTLVLGLLSSPVLISWYSSPRVTAVVDYKHADDGRCVPQHLNISNTGKAAATNVWVQYSTDYFSKRGDVIGYYSGDVSSHKIIRNVDYSEGENHILIPSLLPGLSQEFIFIEEPKIPGMSDKRLALITKKDPAVFNYPRIDVVTSNEGQVGLIIGSNDCT